jgi:hypothetical protein
MKSTTIPLTILIALVIAACGAQPTSSEPTPDVAAVRTSAASTVVSQFTLTAAVFTPTPSDDDATEEPQATEQGVTATDTQPVAAVQVTNASGTPESLCDSLGFDVATVDVNIPDNTIMTPGQDFIKTWKVQNTGTCPWGAGYVLAYAGYDDDMDGQFIAMTEVIQPGQEVEVSVQFQAPDLAGTYLSAWSMRNPAGVFFPQVVFVKIIVQ